MKFFLLFFFQTFLWSLDPIPLSEKGHEWMEKAIEREFAAYEKKGICQSLIEKNWEILQTDSCFQRFKIINSTVHGPAGQVKNLLEVMVEHYPVPDIDFIWYNWDCLRKKFLKQFPLNDYAPIFVSAKRTDQTQFILFADWYYDIHDSSPRSWNKIIDLFDDQTDQTWSDKIEKLFWRGSPTDGPYRPKTYNTRPRGRVVVLSLENPLIDAAFTVPGTNSHIAKKFQDVLRVTPPVPLIDHLNYKYQLIIDGVTCTFPGTQWRLYSGCLSFKQESDNIMWFFGELQPYVHYIPVHNDMSNLPDQIAWALKHDKKCREMAEEAKLFAKTHLLPEHILLYCYKVLLKYASLMRVE